MKTLPKTHLLITDEHRELERQAAQEALRLLRRLAGPFEPFTDLLSYLDTNSRFRWSKQPGVYLPVS